MCAKCKYRVVVFDTRWASANAFELMPYCGDIVAYSIRLPIHLAEEVSKLLDEQHVMHQVLATDERLDRWAEKCARSGIILLDDGRSLAVHFTKHAQFTPTMREIVPRDKIQPRRRDHAEPPAATTASPGWAARLLRKMSALFRGQHSLHFPRR